MKKLVLLMCLIVVIVPIFADKLTVVSDYWIPYNGDPKAEKPGYGIEILVKIFEDAGHTVVYKILPWNRAILTTRNGDYNAIIGAIIDDAPDFVYPEEEFGISDDCYFVTNESTWEYKGVESFNGLEVGLIKDYSYGTEIDKYFKDNPARGQYVYGDDPLEQNIDKLITGRINVLIEDANVLLAKANKMGVADKIKEAKSIKSTDDSRIFVAFSPSNPKSKEYAKIYTEGIKKLKASGELDKILKKYGLKYWK